MFLNPPRGVRVKSSSGGIGFVGLLTIAFIVLKLTNVIDWGWGWVLSPLWILVSIAAVAFVIGLFVTAIKLGLQNRPKKSKKV